MKRNHLGTSDGLRRTMERFLLYRNIEHYAYCNREMLLLANEGECIFDMTPSSTVRQMSWNSSHSPYVLLFSISLVQKLQKPDLRPRLSRTGEASLAKKLRRFTKTLRKVASDAHSFMMSYLFVTTQIRLVRLQTVQEGKGARGGICSACQSGLITCMNRPRKVARAALATKTLIPNSWRICRQT